jgi:CRISPR-associated endonuclease/helicase Cas3
VVISNYQEPDSFLRVVQDQLEALEVKAIATIPPNRQGEVSRKTIKVKTDTKVGFSVHLDQLSDEDSIKIQRFGIGGKRHMGCGFFQVF